MRIAVPVLGERVCPALISADGVRLFEDDHGRIVRSFRFEADGGDFPALLALLEQHGIDALLCGEVTAQQRRELTMAGLMTFPGYRGAAEDAALAFLSGAVVSDPGNTCNACGHRGDGCSACTIRP